MKGAMSCLEKMKENNIDATLITYNTLINGFISSGESDKAHAMMKEASELLSYLNTFIKCVFRLGYTLDIWTYASIIKGYVKERKMKDALELHKSLIRNGFKHNIVINQLLI